MTDFSADMAAEEERPSLWGRMLDALLPARRQARVLREENQRLEAFLHAVPIEYCGWDQSGAQASSPGFARVFGCGFVSSLRDVQQALPAGDAAALEGLFDRLQHYGECFDLVVSADAGEKTLKIFGKRGALGAGTQVFSVLWVHDITDFATAVQRSQQAIGTAEKREGELRSLLNALPFAVWLRDQALDLAWCNKFYARVVDDTAAAVVAEQKELPVTGAGKNDHSQRVLAQKALATQAPQTARGHIVVEGQRRLMEMTEIPLGPEKPVAGVALDVTREEEWESSHRRLAASHREALEQLRTAIAMFDAETRLEFYNSAYEQLAGLSGTWLDSRPRLTDIIDRMRELRRLPEQVDYRQFRQNWISKFTSLLEPHEEMQYLPDGSVVRLVVVPRPMGGFLLTLEDVTSRLQLETSYNTLMAVQQETIDNLAEGIAVFGEDGRLRLSNQAFLKIWKLAPEDLAGAPHISQLAEKVRAAFAPEAWAAARQLITGNALEREPRRGRLPCGADVVLEYSVMPLPDGNILNTYYDITDTVKVEQALMEKNAALQEAERLKSDFLANVSYQLRTPLNAIMGFAEMLHQQYFGKLNERQREYTGNMIEAGQRLVSLINDILDLSTIEAGYLHLHAAEVNMKALLGQVMQLTQDWARKQGLDVAIECPDENLTVTADERRLKQVLLNLISNAINYSPNGGTVTLSAARDGDFAQLCVRDTGTGIPAADLASIFTPFERIHSRKTRRRSGAGLGLTLVKSIVELHGGSVAIQSEEGVGTRVTCRLPLRPPETQKR